MSEEEKNEILEVIRDTIEKKVNGKIDRLHEKVDRHNTKHEGDMQEVKEHMKKVEPILEAYTGVGALGSLMKWVSGVVASAGIIWLAVKGFFPGG